MKRAYSLDLFDILSSLVERNLDLESTGLSLSLSLAPYCKAQSSLQDITNLLIALFVTSEQYCESALKILKGRNNENYHLKKHIISMKI